MWNVMASVQHNYHLQERLLRAIGDCSNYISNFHESVEELLDEGADVNQQSGTLCPLHCACMVANAEITRLLLHRGALVNSYDGHGRSALHYAAEKSVKCVEILLEYGADVDITDIAHTTPLHWAAIYNQVASIESLLKHGASVNSLDRRRSTPMSWAAMKGNFHVVRVLLDYGARVDIPDFQGNLPLTHTAVTIARGLDNKQDNDCFELLLLASGNVDLRRENGRLPNRIAMDSELNDILTRVSVNPQKLQQLCRFYIRRYLTNSYLPTNLPNLPLPKKIIAYLLLRQ